MGNTSGTEVINPSKLSRIEFTFDYAIGRGGFGIVWVVKFHGDKKYYAMKEMQKLKIASKKSILSIMNEKKLLTLLRHPFIVNIKFSFQDRDNLYLVMDLMLGGDLRYHINNQKKFTEAQTKFFTACVLAGLEYIHVNSIIHRDIKPENLVLDNRGYIRITDFGIAKICSGDNSNDNSGTPGYMAPEVMNREHHNHAADYFALGVIVFELMMGRRPYTGKNKGEIKQKIFSKQVGLRKSEVPAGWSLESVDFVNKLLERKPSQRLGSGGPHELKSHLWLRDFDWKALMEKKLKSPFKPKEFSNFDPRIFFDIQDDNDYSIDISSMQEMFSGYYFDWRDSHSRSNETTLKVQAKCN